MTIDDQLRDLARRAEQQQQVITADEIVQRAASHGTGSFTTRSRFDDPPKVLNHMPVQFTEEEATMIDLETPSQTEERRKGPKRVLVAGLLAAAAVAAIALVAIRNDDPVSPADQPSPTVTAAPTVPPRALFGTPDERFVPGTYYVDEVEGTATPRIFVTLGDGWSNVGDKWLIGHDVGGTAAFSRADRVFADACHASEGFHPGPVTTLDGLVAALSEQQGWADVTAPSDITINGYPGKQFQRTAPADFTGCNPGDAAFRGWQFDGAGGTGMIWYAPGQVETLLVLDVNGTVIIIDTRAMPDQQEAAAAVLDSIRIEQT
jgi:hypothetical protein